MDKKIIEKLIISEINDFRRISGLPLLNEGGKSDIARGAIRVIDDIFGITSKTVDKLATEVGGDAARLLKKLADPNDTTPIIKIIDDLMVANKTVGRNVYVQLRNHLDTIVDSSGKSLRDKLDEISTNSKKMIDDGKTVDEAAEYFETEMKRILDDSTADEELISAITKYEKDINRDWFPTPLKPTPTPPEPANTPDGPTGDVGNVSTSTNINKTLNDVVNELSDEDAQKLFEYVMKKPWRLSFQNLMKRIRTLLVGGRKLQDETLNLIGALRKTEDVTKETALIEQIVKNVQDLKTLESKMYKQLNAWIEKYLKNAPDRDIRQLYAKLSQEEGWGKIKELDGFFKRIWGGAKTGFIDYGSHSRDLRNGWLKLMTRPFTLPVEFIRIMKEGTNFKWLTKLTDAEKEAFKKWFMSGSPSGWEKMGDIGKKMGFPGQITYVSSQIFRRWVSLKFMVGFFQTLIGAGIHYAGHDEKLQEHPMLDDYFGLNPYEQNSGSVAFLKNILDNASASEFGWAIPFIGFSIDAYKGAGHLMRGKFSDDLEVAKTEVDKVEDEAEKQGIITPTTGTTTDLSVKEVREVLPEKYRDYVYRKESGDIYLEWEGMTYPIEKKDNIFWIYLEGHESPYKLEDIEF